MDLGRSVIMKGARELLLELAKNPPPERVGKGLDLAKMVELHEQIARGVIDIGPFPDHTSPTKDLRYKGPSAEELGAKLLARTNGHTPKLRDMPKLRDDYRDTI
jgi:hypothetical protein